MLFDFCTSCGRPSGFVLACWRLSNGMSIPVSAAREGNLSPHAVNPSEERCGWARCCAFRKRRPGSTAGSSRPTSTAYTNVNPHGNATTLWYPPTPRPPLPALPRAGS